MIDNMKITSAKYVSIEGSVSTILATIDGVKWQGHYLLTTDTTEQSKNG